MASTEPASTAGDGGQEAYFVFSRVGGAESEFAGSSSLGADDAVVVVEDLIDGYLNFDVGIDRERLCVGVELFGFVVACIP